MDGVAFLQGDLNDTKTRKPKRGYRVGKLKLTDMNKNLIATLAISGLVVILAIFYIPWHLLFSPTEIIYCGADKTKPIVVFKNPSEAFPAFAQDYSLNVSSGIKILDSASNDGKISIEAKKEIKNLRELLNQDNIQFENLLKSAFYAYNQDGCNDDVKKRYWDVLNMMSDKVLKLQQLKNTLPQTIKEDEKTIVEQPQLDTIAKAPSENPHKPNRSPSSIPTKPAPQPQDKTLEAVKAFSNNYFPVQWVKEGYYIAFGDIRMKLESFENNNSTAVLSTCQTATSVNCTALESNIRVSADKSYKFKFNGYIYEIVLQKIDHAGKDPNTLAAYISLKKELL